MRNSFRSLISVVVLMVMGFGVFYFMKPQAAGSDESAAVFSTKRALVHVKKMAVLPHYVGSDQHEVVAQYVAGELRKMGLEPVVQEGFELSDWGNLTHPKNIMARVKGTGKGKALLLLSHYDSAPHGFSCGASDDAVGVATVLEGVRAFLHSHKAPKNDIIILFTDAEELGLNGAGLFVMQHGWAKDIGLAINFEARGSSGPSFMLMEVTKGNAAMVQGFSAAHPEFGVSNSLLYSIYKMLPNDTDLTVFREQGRIQGFNFAFIDNHFNYHTAQDDYAHLDVTTLEHQGSYLMPMLDYFSETNLGRLVSKDDWVYFNTPFGFFSYPFSWLLPIWVVTFLVFIGIVFVGVGKRSLEPLAILKGFIPFLIALIGAGLLTFSGWKLVLYSYPQYADILQGFTYNGHSYIAAFVLLGLSMCFVVYQKFSAKKMTLSYAIAPIFVWLIINLVLVFKLPGAGFLIFPAISGLLMLLYPIVTQKTSLFLQLVLALPVLILLVPFIQMFPIGLGLKILYGSIVLVVFSFGLLLPIFGEFKYKYWWALLFFVGSCGFFINAHLHSGYSKGAGKPNSLLYVLDKEQNKAVWATYDLNLDVWTKTYLTNKPDLGGIWNTFPLYSKYHSDFTFTKAAPVVAISGPSIQFTKDSIGGNFRYLKIKITPNRKVNRYDVFANLAIDLFHFKANGTTCISQKGIVFDRNDSKVISYYVVNNEPLELEFDMDASMPLDMDLLESSFDLLYNPVFKMAKRNSWMLPTPFVLNDAVVLHQKVNPTSN